MITVPSEPPLAGASVTVETAEPSYPASIVVYGPVKAGIEVAVGGEVGRVLLLTGLWFMTGVKGVVLTHDLTGPNMG